MNVAAEPSWWERAALSRQGAAPRQGFPRTLLAGLTGRQGAIPVAPEWYRGELHRAMSTYPSSPIISARASLTELARQFADCAELGEAELPALTRRQDAWCYEGRCRAEVDALCRRLLFGRTSRRAEEEVLARSDAARAEEVRADGVLRAYMLGRASADQLLASRIRSAFRWGRHIATRTVATEAAIALGAPSLDDAMASLVAQGIERALRRLPAARAARLAADAREVEAFAPAAAR